MAEPILAVADLTTVFDLPAGPAAAVEDLSLEVGAGETLGLIGESGSGKTVAALSILRLVRPPGRITRGRVRFKGRDLLQLSEREIRDTRGAAIGMIFQEPSAALNPVFTIGDQIGEALLVHRQATRREVRTRVIALLDAVRMPDPAARVDDYPHQLSGGMRQRALIAMAIACRPPLIIADEPTTGLDALVQAQVLDLLREMRRAFDLSLLLITHDLGVVAEVADRVAVMYAGRIVETGPIRDVLRNPRHPYTRGLLESIPGGTRGQPLRTIAGSPPLPESRPAGCAFHPRCPDRFDPCPAAPPAECFVGPNHAVRCYLHQAPAGTDRPSSSLAAACNPGSAHAHDGTR